jgi:hypothetical protein
VRIERAAFSCFLALAFAMGVVGATTCGCSSAPSKRQTLVTERRDCLLDQPPEQPGGVLFEACPNEEWAACLSRESAIAVLLYVRRLQSYAHEAWIRCGYEPTEGGP